MANLEEIKNVFADAYESTGTDQESEAIREIMVIEKDCHYNKKSSRERLLRLREIIEKNALEEL